MRSWRETSLGDKAAAAAKSSREWRSWSETSLGDRTAAAAKSSPGWRSWSETSLGDKAAAAAKSSPKGKSGRETSWETRQQPRAAQNGNHEGRQAWNTNEGRLGSSGSRQGGSASQEQPRMEIMKGDKWSETRRQRQPRAAQNGDHVKGDKAAAASKPFGDFGDQQPSHWEVRTASSYLGKNLITCNSLSIWVEQSGKVK